LYNGTLYSYKSNITMIDVSREYFGLTVLASGTSQQYLSPLKIALFELQ